MRFFKLLAVSMVLSASATGCGVPAKQVVDCTQDQQQNTTCYVSNQNKQPVQVTWNMKFKCDDNLTREFTIRLNVPKKATNTVRLGQSNWPNTSCKLASYEQKD